MPRTYRKGLGRSRLAQLRSDLKLSPEARVLEAEEPSVQELAEQASPRRPRRARRRGRVAEGRGPIPADRYATKLALVCYALNEAGARYLVVGGKALQLWGTSRYTKDTDILIEPTPENAERVLAGLSRIGFGIAAELTPEEVLARHVTIIGDTPRVDVLTRAWNVKWEDAFPRAVTFEVEGVAIPTASIEDLIESKRTGRLQDAADIEMLEAIRRERNRKPG